MQGFARHLTANAEPLRYRFVTHAGKAEINVIRDRFIRGFSGNDWEGVFDEFAAQIRAHTGPQAHTTVVRNFSTTGVVERAAFQLTLMDAMQQYFDYVVVTRCGFPSITLEGTPEDWVSVRAGAAALAAYDLTWWTAHLLPVLDQFVHTVDKTFWQNLYKIEGGSGGPYISGYLVNFSPYLGSTQPYRNNYFVTPSNVMYSAVFEGMTTRDLPPALCVASFTWKYLDQELPMEFFAGFIGAAQDANTLALRPEIGWAVRGRSVETFQRRK